MTNIDHKALREKILSEAFDSGMTQEEYLTKIAEEPDFFRKINFIKLNHKEFVLKAIDILPKGQSYLFRKLPEALKDDKDVALKMVEKSYTSMEIISSRLMKDKDIALVCLKQDGSSLQYLAYDLVDELVENAVTDKNSAIKYLELFALKNELEKDLSKQETQPKKLKI
jgi:hypothetical protein